MKLLLICLSGLLGMILCVDASITTERVAEKFFSSESSVAARRGWSNTTDEQILEAIDFLIKFAPKPDLDNLTVDFMVENVQYAFQARETFPWGKEMPWHIWLNDVLPYAMLNEKRDNWRPMMFNYFMSSYKSNLTSNSSWTTLDAVMFMNKVAWTIVNPPVHYQESPPDQINQYSVFAVMAKHYASCTGLSTFFSACLRSIGVPIRVTGTPHWNKGPKICPNGDQNGNCGNHDWVEVFVNNSWAFDGLNGGYNAVYPTLNTSWFFPYPARDQIAGITNHSINAASWAPSQYMISKYKALQYIDRLENMKISKSPKISKKLQQGNVGSGQAI